MWHHQTTKSTPRALTSSPASHITHIPTPHVLPACTFDQEAIFLKRLVGFHQSRLPYRLLSQSSVARRPDRARGITSLGKNQLVRSYGRTRTAQAVSDAHLRPLSSCRPGLGAMMWMTCISGPHLTNKTPCPESLASSYPPFQPGSALRRKSLLAHHATCAARTNRGSSQSATTICTAALRPHRRPPALGLPSSFADQKSPWTNDRVWGMTDSFRTPEVADWTQPYHWDCFMPTLSTGKREAGTYQTHPLVRSMFREGADGNHPEYGVSPG